MLAWYVDTFAGDYGALEGEAARLAPGETGLVALDWWNGNRSILADAELTGVIAGLTLHSTQAEIYRALLESIAFGNRRIMDNFTEHGVELERDRRLRRDRRAQPADHAVARRHERPSGARAGVDRGPGARLGAVRRRRGRSLRRHRRGDRRDAPRDGADLHAGPRRPRRSTTRCTPSIGSVYETLGRTQVELLHGLKRIRTNQRRAS